MRYLLERIVKTSFETARSKNRARRNSQPTSRYIAAFFMGGKMELNEKIEAIADKYGFNIQSVKLAEECAEYAAATLKIVYYQLLNDNSLILGLDWKIVAEKLDEARGKGTEELADVLLLSRQLEYIINKSPEARETMDKLMSEKADRQIERIKEGRKQ